MEKLAHLNIIIKPVKEGFFSGETVSQVFFKKTKFRSTLVLVRIDPTEREGYFNLKNNLQKYSYGQKHSQQFKRRIILDIFH